MRNDSTAQEEVDLRADFGPTTNQERLVAIRRCEHAHCYVCNQANGEGLHLDFQTSDDGGVIASFPCGELFQGYDGLLHGGVVSSLLDGAMTNCLFAHEKVAVTSKLSIRFLHPVVVNHPATVRAWVEKSHPPLHVLKAELKQGSKTLAKAEGRFMERPFPSPEGKS